MKKNLGQQIKKYRLKRTMSLSKLAARAGISKSYMSTIEKHETNPSVHILQRIEGALEVPIMQLLEVQVNGLDPEWVELLKEAKAMGIKKEEIRMFLAYEVWKRSLKEGV